MFAYPKQYDVIVVGAGHAGIEAALASARMGCQTLLLTINADTIGQMSCNPAIGGLAKGHLVREIDALGGEMGKVTDFTGLQFRMLNTKKGPAVWSPRAQCDKKAYQFRMKLICEREVNLDVKQGQTSAIICKDKIAIGVETTIGVQFFGKTIVITTGTFLRGLLHIGMKQQSGGRAGEAAAMSLSDSLSALGLELGRLKTGTPPRLLKKSIDFNQTESQSGDDPVPYFSYWPEEKFHMEHNQSAKKYLNGSILDQIQGQLPCFITHTTKKTAEIINANLHLSPMYSGIIEGVGPRYCPSIEDKIVRFPEKDRHQIFLEPEGIATDEIYVNGLSTSLPFEVQIQIVRSLPGCENAEIMRPAYAVEYDFAFPNQLLPSLETKVCQNLFLGGQINGTSGYEEAAAQGLMAGINAARRVQEKPPVVLQRNQAYIGVLIDDLITKGTTEPYRMFTSRAEYRLLLRQDNADLRLSEIGRNIGLLPEQNFAKTKEKISAIEKEINRLHTVKYENNTLYKILSRSETTYDTLPNRDLRLPPEIARQVEIEVKYGGYIKRQELEVKKFSAKEEKQIPRNFDFGAVYGLRPEARQKLLKFSPATIGQATRISGVTPADISLLLVWLKRGEGSARAEHKLSPLTTESAGEDDSV